MSSMIELRLCACNDRDIRARIDIRQRNRAADTSSTSGDERYFACEKLV